jgi:hypothetical protein
MHRCVKTDATFNIYYWLFKDFDFVTVSINIIQKICFCILISVKSNVDNKYAKQKKD